MLSDEGVQQLCRLKVAAAPIVIEHKKILVALESRLLQRCEQQVVLIDGPKTSDQLNLFYDSARMQFQIAGRAGYFQTGNVRKRRAFAPKCRSCVVAGPAAENSRNQNEGAIRGGPECAGNVRPACQHGQEQ